MSTTPAKVSEVFDLDELNSYPIPVHVKKEPNKPASTPKSAPNSKLPVVPKPSPATKPRALSSRKRKETDSQSSSETFPFENHGFLESSGFMTDFLNQGLERLTSLYEESCGLSKMLEVKLRKAKTTITDQGMIASAKSQH
ncbi:hypothetical protein Hanom_Chr10g00905401 [Helianthus anomalus]